MIRQQIHVQPIRLVFKLKFYVPPHLLVQQSTRHYFYLNIRASLREKQLKVTDTAKQAKLIALIAQAELGNYRSDSIDLKQLYSEWILLFDASPPVMVADGVGSHQGTCSSGAVELIRRQQSLQEQPASTSSGEVGAHKRRKHHSDSSIGGLSSSIEEEMEEDEGDIADDDIELNTVVQFAIESPATSTSTISASAPDLICHSMSLGSIGSNLQGRQQHHLSTAGHAQFYRSIVEYHLQLHDCLPSSAENKFLEEIVELEDIGIDFFAACDCDGQGKCTIGVGTRGVTIKHTDAPNAREKKL